MDNKFGKCCNCPGKMGLMRQFTDYRASSIAMIDDMNKGRYQNIYEYGKYIEQNGYANIQKSIRDQEKSYKCKSNGKHTFRGSTSNYTDTFAKELAKIPKELVVPYDQNIMSGVLSTNSKPNYNTKYINSDVPMYTLKPTA